MAETTTKPNVIVVDNERLIADTLTAILNQSGYEASALYSGEEALEWVTNCPPDVVLSDIRMHRMDGIETARRIRILHPGCRIVLFSPFVTEFDQIRIDSCGCELLHRPLHPKDVLEQLRCLIPERAIPSPSSRS
jgi:DNA-binding response OmpR family regulator